MCCLGLTLSLQEYTRSLRFDQDTIVPYWRKRFQDLYFMEGYTVDDMYFDWESSSQRKEQIKRTQPRQQNACQRQGYRTRHSLLGLG
ncbi:unnamed protein product [Sphagnum balticum]